MRIASIETRRYRVAFDPPFRAAWDPVPRTGQDATLVIVTADDGTQGFASGDHLPDADVLAPLVVGLDPRRTEVVRELVETVDFHGGRGLDPGGRRLGPRRARARHAALAAPRRPLRQPAGVRVER